MSEANKRKRLNGFQYRKIAKAKKEKEDTIVRKSAKLDTYFKIKVSVIHIIIVNSVSRKI